MLYLYELICPIRNSVCYVGLTNNPEIRYKQHIKDCYRYKTKIAKFIRHLKSKGLENQLRMEVIKSFDTKEEAGEAERQRIALRRLQGKIYNILDGGYDQAPNYSRKAVMKLLEEGRLFGGVKIGEDNNLAILKEVEVLQIYEMFKDFYSNKSIIEKLNLSVNTNAVTSIRKGVNWSYLWGDHFTAAIESPGECGTWLKSRDKLVIIMMSSLGLDVSTAQEFYPNLVKGDYKRAAAGSIWKKVWKFLELYPERSEKIYLEKVLNMA